MSKAALKKELREIDRQLARFGVLIQNKSHEASEPIEVALENIGIETMPFNTASEKIQRNTKCKHMKEHLEKYGYYEKARAFDPNKVDPLLDAETEYYTKCLPDNIYGKSIEQSPYLWPLIAIPPEKFRYISIHDFLDKVENGTLTRDELFMFTLVHSINHAMNNGMTALMYAAEEGSQHIRMPEIAGMLLDSGAEINQVDNNEGWTAFMHAAAGGSTEIVSMILDRGADINQVDNNGITALIYTCQVLMPHMTEFLLDRGADVNHADNYGWTALMYASRTDSPDIVGMLLDSGAEVNQVDNEGDTALLVACERGILQVATMLLDRGADVNQVNNQGDTALMYACKWKELQVATMLLNRGADVNQTNNDGLTALLFASQQKKPEIVSMLLDRGAEVNHADNNGMTALMYASENDSPDIVAMLLVSGADNKV